MDKIKYYMQGFVNWNIQHCYKEDNKVADMLANWGLSCTYINYIYNNHLLPREARGEMNMDISPLPSFRINKHRKSFFVERNMYIIHLLDVP